MSFCSIHVALLSIPLVLERTENNAGGNIQADQVKINLFFLFQAIAREDKGILGKEWNRSDKTYFRTTSYNPTVTPDSDGGDSSNRGNKYQSGGSTSVYSPQVDKGPPQLKKSLKFQLFALIFQTPLFERDPTDENLSILYLKES